MPIVNKANYVSCPSCGKWMHRLPFLYYVPCNPRWGEVESGNITGNRALICQECYERADGQSVQAVQTEGQRKLAEQAKPFGTPVTRAKWDMSNNDEVKHFIVNYQFASQQGIPAFSFALNQFIQSRNAKL